MQLKKECLTFSKMIHVAYTEFIYILFGKNAVKVFFLIHCFLLLKVLIQIYSSFPVMQLEVGIRRAHTEGDCQPFDFRFYENGPILQ